MPLGTKKTLGATYALRFQFSASGLYQRVICINPLITVSGEITVFYLLEVTLLCIYWMPFANALHQICMARYYLALLPANGNVFGQAISN